MDEIPTWATDIAAQIWCQPENEDTEMDVNLCASFALALVAERERAAKIAETLPDWKQPREAAAAIRKGE